MENKDIAMKAGDILSSKKAENIIILGIAEQSSFADFFVNATARNERQMSALVSEVEDQLAMDGMIPKNIEGKPSSGWMLMDYGDIIVNLFLQQQRELYQLERIWRDGELITID